MKQKTKTTKNLPGLFKKKYTEKKLNKKIYKKLYIPEDKALLQSLFQECGQTKKGITLFAIPKDNQFTKKEIKHFKKIKKDIKKQKGRIKVVPLIAVAVFIFALVSGFMLTKNLLVKKAIVSTVQSITEARCDIKDVDFKIFESTFTLKGLEVANKNSPMKNLFSIETITIDFDLLQLLKARFVANDLSMLGVYVNSDRTYDGTLPPKIQKKIKKEKEQKQSKEAEEESKLLQSIKAKSNSSLDTIQTTLTGVLDQYNPETYVTKFYSNMESPAVATEVQKTVEEMIVKYSELPAQLESEIKIGQDTINSIMNIDFQSMQTDPAKIKEAIETITIAYNNAVKIKEDTERVANEIQKDVNLSIELSEKITNSVMHDQKMLNSEINKITSFKLDDGKQIITGTFDTLAYQLLGKYYPYAVKATHYLSNLKNNKKEKKVKTKKITKRAAGRNVYYRVDNTPQFLIKNIAGSGHNFSFQANNITNEMDKTKKPATGTVSFTVFDVNHKADFSVDTRTNTTAPLISAAYDCNNIPVSLPTSQTGNIPGVPGLESSTGKLSFLLELFENEAFNLEGNGILENTILTTTAFEPAILYDLYQEVLSEITQIDLGIKTGFSNENGFNLNLVSTVDKQFMNALSKSISNQLNKLIDQISQEILKRLNEITNGAFADIQNFNDIQRKVEESKAYAENMVKEIENKKNQAQNLLNKGLEDAQKAVQEASEQALKQAEEAAKKAQEEARAAAEAEANRIKAEMEAAAKQKEEELKKQALDAAKNAFKGFF